MSRTDHLWIGAPDAFRIPVLAMATLCGLFLAAQLVRAATLICDKCSYENAATQSVCTHCSAALTPLASNTNRPAAVAQPALLVDAFLQPEVVQAELDAGTNCFLKGDPDVACLLFRNALGLEQLTDPSTAGERPTRIRDLLRRAESATRLTEQICPECQGSGKRMMSATSLNGEVTRREVAGAACATCGGSGKTSRDATVQETKFRIGRAQGRYRTAQQARRLMEVGDAWAPATVATNLNVRQMAILKRSTSSPCDACMGIGKEDCSRCKGSGHAPCSDRACKNGMVTVKAGAKLSGTKAYTVSEKCKTCKGAGFLPCVTCGGNGTQLCRPCNGTGQREACRKCGGEGFSPCSRCKGGGKQGDVPCASCRAEGVVLCAACKGDGHAL